MFSAETTSMPLRDMHWLSRVVPAAQSSSFANIGALMTATSLTSFPGTVKRL